MRPAGLEPAKPPACKAGALPTELRALIPHKESFDRLKIPAFMTPPRVELQTEEAFVGTMTFLTEFLSRRERTEPG